MSKQTIDYTTSTKRLGSKTPDGKLVKCPKCGKKGALSPETETPNDKGWVAPGTVLHSYKREDNEMYVARMDGERCVLPLSERGEALRGLKGLFEGLRIWFRDATAAELKKLYPDGYGRAYFTLSLNPSVVHELLAFRERALQAEALALTRKVVALGALDRALSRIEELDDTEAGGHEDHAGLGQGPTSECDVCRIEAVFEGLGGKRGTLGGRS